MKQYRIYTEKNTIKGIPASEYYVDADTILEAIAVFYQAHGYRTIEEVKLVRK